VLLSESISQEDFIYATNEGQLAAEQPDGAGKRRNQSIAVIVR